MRIITILSLFSMLVFAKEWNFAIGLQGSSLLQKRGIITYEGPQIVPIYSIDIIENKFFLAGSALYYKSEVTEKVSLLSRLNLNATNDRPFYETSEDEDKRFQRETTNEVDIILQYNFTHSSYLRLEYSKDIKAHKGNYFELEGRYDFRSNKNASLFQPGIFSSIGFGDKSHNKYLYGLERGAFERNNVEYGFSIISPVAINNFWPTLKVSRFEILGNENRNGAYVNEKSGYQLEFLFAKKLW